MKPLFLYCLLFLFVLKIDAQINLVPNPSFEDSVSCPTSISQLFNCAGWVNPNNAGPEYYNSCADYNSTFVSVPSNAFGFQEAYTGSAYVGLLVYQRTAPGGPFNYREYIQTELTDSLKMGMNYCVSFYLNYASVANIAIDNIGLSITNTPISNTGPTVLSNIPQIISPSGIFLNDTLNWYKVEGIYTALGGEKYITIGNFKDALNTDTLHTDPFSASSAYYYIDEVAVVCCDSVRQIVSGSLNIPNIFSPNNDGINDEFIINNLNQGSTVTIYDRWGIVVFQQTTANQQTIIKWDGRTTSNQLCVEGVYFYVVSLSDGENYKGYLELIR